MVDLGDLVRGGHSLPRWLLLWGEKFLGLHALNVAHARIEDDWEEGSRENFFRLACKYLPLRYDLEGLENIPAEGPCVIVCNHPHGMSDGLMFGDAVMRVRQDIRIVVNDFLSCVRGMRPYEITVDVYGGEAARRANMAGMREMLAWLRGGHCILVFPSGSVASYSCRDHAVIDDPWQTNIATLIRKTGATVVPMYIAGRTGVFFQMLTVLAKNLRPNLLPREIKRDIRMRHSIRIGKAVSPSSMALLEQDNALSDYLRLSSMLLRYPHAPSGAPVAGHAAEPVADSEPAEALQAELDALPASCLCFSHECSGLQVFAVEASRIPRLMQEIGVQRERTFRAVGEGTGKSRDLDVYDSTYVHLIMWDARAKKLAGAYRMGRTDAIMEKQGIKGIYNASFFRFSKKMQGVLRAGLEMGRAFITPEYQKHSYSLDTLWMGIGRYMNNHPEYRYLYGTVSISSEYSVASRSLILSWLKTCRMAEEAAREVKAFFPPEGLGLRREDIRLLPEAVPDVRALNNLVNNLEPDGKSVPVLLRQYLRLGGEMLSFGIDNDFGGTLDCLVIVDLSRTPERILRRYRGKDYMPPPMEA